MFTLESVVSVTGFGNVTCCSPLVHEEKNYLAFGTDNGIYVTKLGDEDPKPRKVISKPNVTKCDTIGPFLIVLADQRILSYHVDSLVAAALAPPDTNPPEPAAVELRDKSIEFFRTGSIDGKEVLIMMHRKKKDNVFRMLELLPKGSKDAFKTNRDFFFPGPKPCFDVSILKSSLAIHKSPGFEIMDPVSFKSVTIPQKDDSGLSKGLHKRLAAKEKDVEKPLGIYRAGEEEFILCYEGLGLFVTRHGDACRGGDNPSAGAKGKVEWTERVTQIAYHASHLFLFGGSSGGVEVRSAESGEVVQSLGFGGGADADSTPGKTRCLWGEGALEAERLYALVGSEANRRITKIVEA